MNAYEHGNLGITEDEKARFLENWNYETELRKREKGCDLRIFINFVCLKDEISISIRDQGFGFDYNEYRNMSENSIQNILRPNGRGIYMALRYFDSLNYLDNGKQVVMVKKFLR